MTDQDDEDGVGGVQAIETGARILNALASLGPAPMLKTIAEHAGMPPSKAHRYLSSFLRTGLVIRDSSSGRYQLGPLAIRIGLIALRRVDVVRAATPALAPLRERIGHSVFLAVWGSNGPTIVRTEETDDPVVISSRAGSVLPIVPSSTGRVFGAYLTPGLTRHFIKRDLQNRRTGPASLREVEKLFADVRAQGLAQARGDLNPGIHSLSAPIFDHEGELVAVLTALGVVGSFDTSLEGPVAGALRQTAMEVSNRLGMETPINAVT